MRMTFCGGLISNKLTLNKRLDVEIIVTNNCGKDLTLHIAFYRPGGVLTLFSQSLSGGTVWKLSDHGNPMLTDQDMFWIYAQSNVEGYIVVGTENNSAVDRVLPVQFRIGSPKAWYKGRHARRD